MQTNNNISATDTTASLARSAAATGNSQSLGQEDFLTLMVTQLRNQDPFKPLEPNEFLGQLAQFSTVSGIESMRSSVAGLADSLQGSQVLQGATLVGRSVLAAGNQALLGSTGAVYGAFGAPPGATQVDIQVRDASGSLVRTFSVPPGDDLTNFAWDGRAADGSRLPAGPYSLSAVARVGGQNESVEMLLQSRVDSVTIDARRGSLNLNTALGSVAMGDVRRIM